jgi:predicted nicotinamide N-methyase
MMADYKWRNQKSNTLFTFYLFIFWLSNEILKLERTFDYFLASDLLFDQQILDAV